MKKLAEALRRFLREYRGRRAILGLVRTTPGISRRVIIGMLDPGPSWMQLSTRLEGMVKSGVITVDNEGPYRPKA
ncbi:MAG: hypothetical protein HW380_686 [Magnetococcales bacterium]|nr:hypothetical protein [Magnetococcales bacterium]